MDEVLLMEYDYDDVSWMTFISSWTPNNFVELPLINVELYGLVLAQGWKKDTIKLGNQFATLGANQLKHLLMSWHQCLACNNNLGPKNKPKMLKVGNKYFGS